MSEVFLKIVNMSISASWLVLAVLVLRLILKKAPKWVNVLLWGIVALRLICPFSIESTLSLIPSAQTLPEEIISGPDFNLQTGIAPVDQQVNDYLNDHYFEGVTVPTNHGANVMGVLTVIWLVGMAILITYTAVSYLRLQRNLGMAVILRENIFQCETVTSPFVLGIIKPRIYLPYSMDAQNMEHVIAHEQAHIRRKDHWWKPLGFLLLTIHWFNPLMWVAYILLCRDIELACDEKVIAELGNEQRADYTQALVACSVNRRVIAACPLAFGEVGVKDRVKSIMNYRKPTFWVIVTALVVCVLVAVCFLTDPNPSREFSMNGKNVSNLDPGAIVERIMDIEGIDNSNVCMNSLNFDLQVDSNFNWANDQTVSYFYKKDHKTQSAQLRIFPDEQKYFLTEPTEQEEQEQRFLLQLYLEAIKYLPQDAIREMAPADQYIIEHREEGRPADYDRVITYSSQGVEDTDGWYIHLQILPLHEDGEAYSGTGDEVLDVFYGASSETASELNFGGNTSLQHIIVLTKEKPYWCIFIENQGTEKIVTEIGGDVTKIEPGTFDKVFSDEKWKPGTYAVSFATAGASGMNGNAVCYTYKYRLEITGRLNNAVKDTTYILLSNIEGITFEQAWKASCLSSNMDDYFDPADVVFIGVK